MTNEPFTASEEQNQAQHDDDYLLPGEATIRDGPAYLNGRSKMYMATIGFLWSSLVGLGGWAVGSRSAAMQLAAHEGEAGHAVMVERVGRLETALLNRLESIDTRLARLETEHRP